MEALHYFWMKDLTISERKQCFLCTGQDKRGWIISDNALSQQDYSNVTVISSKIFNLGPERSTSTAITWKQSKTGLAKGQSLSNRSFLQRRRDDFEDYHMVSAHEVWQGLAVTPATAKAPKALQVSDFICWTTPGNYGSLHVLETHRSSCVVGNIPVFWVAWPTLGAVQCHTLPEGQREEADAYEARPKLHSPTGSATPSSQIPKYRAGHVRDLVTCHKWIPFERCPTPMSHIWNSEYDHSWLILALLFACIIFTSVLLVSSLIHHVYGFRCATNPRCTGSQLPSSPV